MCPTYPRISLRKPKGWRNKSYKDHLDHVRAGYGLKSRAPKIRPPRLASKEYRARQYTRQQISALSRFGGVLLTILESSDVTIKASNGSTLDVSACAREIDSWVQIIKACVSGAKGQITGFGDVRVERNKLILSKDLLFGAVQGSLSFSLNSGISLGFSVLGKKVIDLKPRENDVEITFLGTIKAKVKYQEIWNELSSKPSVSTHRQALYTSSTPSTYNSKPTED
jgi:hypothetical protein